MATGKKNGKGVIVLALLALLLLLMGQKKPPGGGTGATPGGSIGSVDVTQGSYAARAHLIPKSIGSTVTLTLTFDAPVVSDGLIPCGIEGGLLPVSQVQTSQTVVVQVYGSSLAGLDYDIPANTPNVKSFQGGFCSGGSGTFP